MILSWNLIALHDARNNLIRTESSESIKQALWHNLRTSCEENYQNGDKVFDQRRALESWNGSATVLEKERNFVLIQHGSAFYRCHSRHIMKATQQKSPTTTGWNQSIKTIDVFQIKFTKKEYSSSDDTEDDIDKEEDNTSNSE